MPWPRLEEVFNNLVDMFLSSSLLLVWLYLAGHYGLLTASSEVCAGEWVEQENEAYNHYPGIRYPKDRYTDDQLLKQACPAEIYINNCFFEGITERAEKLSKRKWVSSDGHCQEFRGFDFLSHMTNRSIYFHGDSTTFQVYTQLVCALYTHVRMEIYTAWEVKKGGTGENAHALYNDMTCPTGAVHCHPHLGMDSAHSYIPSLNAHIYFGWFGHYEAGKLIEIINSKKLTKNDFVLVNFGVWYNFGHEAWYEKTMKTFLADTLHVSPLGALDTTAPRIFFTETMPQHFTGDTHKNGYIYTPEAATWCAKYENETFVADHDWRNRIAERVLGDSLPRIKIAKALYSQYDAHLDGDSPLLKGLLDPADCTHYCAPSGVFNYIHTMIFNTLFPQ